MSRRPDFPLHSHWIPLAPGHAVSAGWCAATDFRPLGVTWHWTATYDLAECDRLLGGATPLRRGQASSHFAVGRSFEEGVSCYVSLEDRSWHAGKNQTLRWDGRLLSHPDEKGARTCIGVETVHIGYARDGVAADEDWIVAHDLAAAQAMRVAPWPDEQVAMMIAIGKRIQRRWPHLGPRDHHGHHDLCPGYKVDVAGFPFARVLRGIYDDPSLPDPWSGTWTADGRRRALQDLGYLPKPRVEEPPLDGRYLDPDARQRQSRLALERFQADHGLPANGLWTTAVAWAVWDARQRRDTGPPRNGP